MGPWLLRVVVRLREMKAVEPGADTSGVITSTQCSLWGCVGPEGCGRGVSLSLPPGSLWRGGSSGEGGLQTFVPGPAAFTNR